MAAEATTAGPLAELAQSHGHCTAPLDAAVEYLRLRVARVLPLYMLAMLPHALIVKSLIAAIAAEQRPRFEELSACLVAATIWRWIWLARIQAGVQLDLGVLTKRPQTMFWKRLLPILQIRLFSCVAVTWGGIAVAPAFYGLFIGSFATPLLLESAEPVPACLRQALSWIHHSARRLIRITLAMSAVACLLMVAAFVGQAVLAGTVLPSLLGLKTADLNVTLDSWAWRLTILYFLFLLLDAYWTVASVIIYYDSQSRRMATDLRTRLRNISEGQS